MTDAQYWEERKKRIKLVNSTYELCKQNGITGGILTDLLISKYGKADLILMEDYEIESFRKWINQNQKEVV